MTRYNPFAYGEVRLDPNQQKGAPSGDAEDLLFAEGEQTKQAPAADASWELMNSDVDDLLPGAAPADHVAEEFGAEILGECDAGAPAGGVTNEYASEALLSEAPVFEPAPDLAEPAPMPEAAPAAAAPPVVPTAPGARREVRRQPVAKGTPATVAAAPSTRRGKRTSRAPKRRRSRVLAGMVPLTLCAGGGTAASWFWVMQSNPVMAGILGAITLVGALFSWLFLRG